MFFSDNAKWKQEENGSSPHTHCICSSCTDRTNRAVCKIHYYAQDIATVRFSEYILYWTKSLPLPISEALPGGSHVARLNFNTAHVGVKMLVAYCRLCRHRHNLAEGGCLLSLFHFTRCCSFLGHVACQNLPWQDLIGLTGIRLEDGLQAFLKKQQRTYYRCTVCKSPAHDKIETKNNGESNNVHCCTI